jgi:hypothetical protein
MLTLLAISIFTIFIAAVLGASLAGYFSKHLSEDANRGPITLAIAVGIGFALSSVAASWSYGLVGADSFIFVLIALFVFSLIALVKKPIRGGFATWREFSKSDLSLFLIPLYAVFLAKPYWDGLVNLRIAAGGGPDIPQNLMTVLAQRRNGNTWFEARENFLTFLGDKNLAEAVYHLYQLPSMQDQAGYDYMVYGTRWGLSIPFAQLLRIDQRWLIAEQGVVLTAGLISLALIVYAFSTLMGNRPLLRVALSLGAMSSASFLVQVFNGGMAQAWGLPGLALMSFVFIMAIVLQSKNQINKQLSWVLIVLAAFGWIGNAVSYIDSSMTMAVVFALSSALLYFVVGKSAAIQSLKVITFGGILAAIAVAPYAYAAIHTMPIRLTLAAGTGIQFNHWPLPSEILGILDVWTQNPGTPRDPIFLLIGVIVSASLFLFIVRGINSKNKTDKSLSALGLAIFLVGGLIALWASQTGIRSNYSFVKVSTYMSPMLIMIISEKFAIKSGSKSNKYKLSTLRGWYGLATPLSFVIVAALTASSANASLYSKAEFSMPSRQLEILTDKEAQAEIENYNYLTTYRAISNLLGVIGNTHWISKAPNDQRLETRLDKELRVLCFAADTACTGPGGELSVPALNKYGMKVFRSPITTEQFNALSPKDRFYAAMDAVGQPRFEVPERFIGGNPLLKTDQ